MHRAFDFCTHRVYFLAPADRSLYSPVMRGGETASPREISTADAACPLWPAHWILRLSHSDMTMPGRCPWPESARLPKWLGTIPVFLPPPPAGLMINTKTSAPSRLSDSDGNPFWPIRSPSRRLRRRRRCVSSEFEKSACTSRATISVPICLRGPMRQSAIGCCTTLRDPAPAAC